MILYVFGPTDHSGTWTKYNITYNLTVHTHYFFSIPEAIWFTVEVVTITTALVLGVGGDVMRVWRLEDEMMVEEGITMLELTVARERSENLKTVTQFIS